MSNDIASLSERLQSLRDQSAQLKELRKEAFMAAPPMPGGGAPPMDPAMMGGAPPMDPAMMGGAPPMDPAMMGAPPMDPAMMGAPPMDPAMAGGMPMDPNAMPPVDGGGEALTPEMVDELLGVIEHLSQASEAAEAKMLQLEEGMSELVTKNEDLESRLANMSVMTGGDAN